MPLTLELPILRLRSLKTDKRASILFSEEISRKYSIAPLWIDSEGLIVACPDPSDRETLRAAETGCRRPLTPYKASYPEIRELQERSYKGSNPAHTVLDLGGILYQLGFLSPTNLRRVRVVQKRSGDPVDVICRDLGLVSERDLSEAMAIYYRVPFFNLSGFDLTYDLVPLIPWELATQRKIIPIWWFSGTLVVAATKLTGGNNLQDISDQLSIPVFPVLCCPSDWERLYRKFYLRGTEDMNAQDRLILESLVEQRLISEQDIEISRELGQQTGQPLIDVMVDHNLISESQWIESLSAMTGYEIYKNGGSVAANTGGSENLDRLIPPSIALNFGILPLRMEDSRLHVAVSRPDPAILRLCERISGFGLVPWLASKSTIEKELKETQHPFRSRISALMPALSDLLTLLGMVTPAQADGIRYDERGLYHSLPEGLVREKYLDEFDLVQTLSLQTGLPGTRLDHARITKRNFSLIPEALAHDHALIPLWANGRDLWMAIADPFDTQGLMQVEKITGMRVQPVLAPRSVISATLDRWLDRRQSGSTDPQVLSVLQHLVGEGVITQVSATAALNAYSRDSLPLDEAIASASLMPRLVIAKALASYNGLVFESLQLVEQHIKRLDALGQEVERTVFVDPVHEQTVTLMTLEQARQYSAIPIRDDGVQLTVGFADPVFSDDLKHLHQLLKRDINPVMVCREEMEDALQRTLGRKTIGTYLLLDGLISRVQLNQALDIARRTGVRLGQALINRGFITDDQLYRYLAKQSSLPLVDLDALSIDFKLANSLPHAFARQNGVLPIERSSGTITLATVDPFNTAGVDQTRLRLGEKISLVLVTESDFEAALERLFKGSYLAQSTSELLERAPQDSAFRVLTRAQAIAFLGLALGSLLWLWFDFNSYIILINALATLFYVGFSSYKFYLVYHALSYNMEMTVSPEELESLDDRDLPVYTLLIPAYKEAEVLPELLSALNRLDYPPTKLDIQVLMEQGDPETIKAYDEWKPPSHFHRVIVPSSIPMTKPKACNYGLIHARGEYVVIYDAEDLPEPDQLKKIVAAFAKAPADVACIQSKLNYFNSEQNILTQWFTIEYSMWFDLFLPGLAASHAPIPLGGTSNHFKRNGLVEVGAWDPYNVTEDADLGIRLFKRGYKTAIVDSTTYEEANSRLYNWLRQRSRWIKGYIQTWLVHMRNPFRLIQEIGVMPFLSFQFVVGGTVFAALLNPIYWLLTTLWFLVHWQFIEAIFPGVIHLLGALALFIGNFAFTYMNVAGALRREKYNMVKYALVSPIYWGLASIGAWMGFIQLLYKPHFWEKTHHGFSKDNDVTEVISLTEEALTPVDLFDIHIQGDHGNPH